MTSKEALKSICLECQKYKGKIQVACPFRSISNEYCDEYEQIEKDLEIAEIIKQKAKGNRFFKGCLLRMFQEDGEKKTYLDNPPRKIEENYYKIKEWLEDEKINKIQLL